MDSLSSYLKGAIVSVGIFYIKNVFNSLVLRLKKLRTDKAIDLEDEDEEIIEEGMWVGKILSERFKNSRVITDERIGKLSLIDESVENKNLKWLVEQENKINWLNIPLSKSIERFNKNKDLFTKTNIQEVTNKFRHINPKDLNNYKSIIELNHINNQLTKKYFPDSPDAKRGAASTVLENVIDQYIASCHQIKFDNFHFNHHI